MFDNCLVCGIFYNDFKTSVLTILLITIRLCG